MKRFLHFLILLVIWLMLTWSLQWQEVAVGIVIALIAELMLGDIFPSGAVKIFYPHRLFWLVIYTVEFIGFVIKANFDVAYRVLNLYLPIRPGIVKVRTKLKTDMARTFLANSITLTPGTVSIRVHGPYITVHAIADDVADGLLEGEMDRRVTTLEGLAS